MEDLITNGKQLLEIINDEETIFETKEWIARAALYIGNEYNNTFLANFAKETLSNTHLTHVKKYEVENILALVVAKDGREQTTLDYL